VTEQDPNLTQVETSTARPAVAPGDSPTVVWTAPRERAAEVVTRAAAAPVRRTRAGSTVRWGIALLVTVVVLIVGFGAAVLLAGQAAPSTLVGYVPAGSLAYGELRLDLPGDQRQKLGQFLSKFPGFADQANLDAKLDEAMDRFVRTMSQGSQDYATKIKPWFGGEIAFSLGDLPDAANANSVHALLIVSVTDPVKARAWIDSVAPAGKTRTEAYNGTDLILGTDSARKGAVAVVGRAMLLGDEASVKQAIDSHGTGSFGADAKVKAATATLGGDSIGSMYLDLRRYVELALAQAKAQKADLGFTFDAATLKKVPEWAAFRVQARGDSLALEAVSPHVATSAPADNRLSDIAPHLPASTIAFAEGHDVGVTLLDAIDMYRKNPGTAAAFKQVDQAALMIGGFDAIVGWMRDASVVVTRSGTTLDGGLVFSPKDRAAGERLLTTLRSFAVIGGGSAGITIKDEPYGGTTITVIDLGDLRDLGAMANIPNVPTTGRLKIAYASTPDLIVLGPGDAFVKSVIDAKPGASLADDARFKGAVERVGARNLGSMYVDLTAVRELAEHFGATSPGMAAYTKDVKPYLERFDAFVEATVVDGDNSRTTGVVVVK
jgi:hypothetical protein